MVCAIMSGMVHIKEPLLLIGKSSPCVGSGFPLLLSEWSSTVCPMHMFSASLNKTFPSFSLPTENSCITLYMQGARCSSVVRAFAHGAMGRWIDPSFGGPIELFLVPSSAPRLV